MPLRRKARLPVMRRSAIEGGKAPIAALALQCAYFPLRCGGEVIVFNCIGWILSKNRNAGSH